MRAKEFITEAPNKMAMNSNGKPIHHTEEGIVNFWKWFKGSKAVDSQGRPLVVYHGTKMDFTEFDIGKGMTGEIRGNPIAKYGFFFSDDPNTANTYAGDNPASNVMPVYLLLKKPFVMDMWRDFGKLSDGKGIVQDDLVKPFIEQLKRKGHDGMILKGGDTYRELMVFEPTQIKSATGNSGTFGINTASIVSESDITIAMDRRDNSMRAKEFITEIFDKPAPYTLVNASRNNWVAKFKIGTLLYTLVATEFHYDPHPPNFPDPNTELDVEFYFTTPDGKSHNNITGTGNQHAVFSTVVAIMKELINKLKPDCISFGSADEGGRRSLYRRLVRTLLPTAKVNEYDGDFFVYPTDYSNEINEARRNPDQNPKIPEMDQLKQILDKNGGNMDNLFVRFTDDNKLGIHPMANDDTPFGICAYPFRYVYNQRTGHVSVPTGGDRRYMVVFKANDMSKTLDLQNTPLELLQKQLYNAMVKQLTIHKVASMVAMDDTDKQRLAKISNIKDQYTFGFNLFKLYTRPGIKEVWRIMYIVLFRIMGYHRENYSREARRVVGLAVRKLLKSCGYNAVIDNGGGIIHPHERWQVVFLSTQQLTLLNVIERFNPPQRPNTADHAGHDEWQ